MNKHQRTPDPVQSATIAASSRGNDGLGGGCQDDPTNEAIRKFENRSVESLIRDDNVSATEFINKIALNHRAVESVPQGFAAQVIETVRERGNAYGTPAENHQTTADLFSAWLSRRFETPLVLTAEDVCALNVIQKISRLANVSKDDSWLDIAGYTENVAMIRADQRNTKTVAKRLDREPKACVDVGSASTFKVGDVVCQNTYDMNANDVVGHDMTIEQILGTAATCVWLEGKERSSFHRKQFSLSELVFVRR